MNNLEFLGFAETVSGLDPVDFQYFDCLLNHRTVLLNDEISENFFELVVLPLQKFEEDDSTKPVKLILNTPGGSIADGLILCSIIDNYKKPLEIIVPSYSCSMGTIILCSGNSNPNVTKKCYPFSFALFHSGQTFLGGETASVDDTHEFNKSINDRIREYVIKNTNISAECYDQHYRKQWYLTSQEMLNYGLVNEIIGKENS